MAYGNEPTALECAKILVENGAEINDPRRRPLYFAAYQGNLELVKYLVEKGN